MTDNSGIATALEIIADKWATPVLRAISEGQNRFGVLQRTVPGISKKMLTQTLRKLERNGIIERIDFEETPPRVEYYVTPLGGSLREHLSDLCQWGNQNGEEVSQARVEYDATQEGWI